MRLALGLMLTLGLLLPTTLAGGNSDPDDNERKLGYSVGYQVGRDLARQDLHVDPEMVIRGVLDALTGSEPRMTEKEMKRTLIKLQREATAAEREQQDLQTRPGPDPEPEPRDQK